MWHSGPLKTRRHLCKWSARIHFIHAQHMEWEWRRALRCRSGWRYHVPLWKLVPNGILLNRHEFKPSIAIFFYSHVPGWQGRLSETAKTISTKTIACQKLFSPWFDWWHHFLLTDMFTSSTFLLPSLPLLPSCSVKQVPSQELIVCSELKYPVIWGGI